MSQDKHTEHAKVDKPKNPEHVHQKIKDTGKKVDKGRRESDTEEEVKSKITGANTESPAH